MQLASETKVQFSGSARRAVCFQAEALHTSASLSSSAAASAAATSTTATSSSILPVTDLSTLPATLEHASAAEKSKYSKLHHKALGLEEQLLQVRADVQRLQSLADAVRPVVRAAERIDIPADLLAKAVKARCEGEGGRVR